MRRLHHNTITMAKKADVRMSISPFYSISSHRVKYVLMANIKATVAKTNSVPCQFCGMYVGSLTPKTAWMTVPAMKAPEALPACHESVLIHPVI